MKTRMLLTILFCSLFYSCEETVYETDPRFFNDAMHGNLTGSVSQSNSDAMVYVSQVSIIDSVRISHDGSFKFTDLEIGNYVVTILADNYRTWKNEEVNIEGGGNTYLGEITLSQVPDMVSGFYPSNTAEIVYDNYNTGLSISVYFAEPMDRESVEEAFSTEPFSEGVFSWGTYYEQPYDYYWAEDTKDGSNSSVITTYSKVKSFTYRMQKKYCFTDTTFKVTLSTQATDTAGNHLRFPLEFSFSTVQSSVSTHIITTSPEDGDINVHPVNSQGITVTFPRKMDQASTDAAISLTPAPDILFYTWPDENKLTIYLGGLFIADTTYTLTIDSTAMDLDGNKMGNQYISSFETAPVTVSSSPANGEVYVSTTGYISLSFNTFIDKNSLQNAFQISPNVSGTIDYSNSYTKQNFKFVPNSELSANTKYTVTIKSTVKDIYNRHLNEDYSFVFVTRP